MIPYERFLECHLEYLEKYKRAKSKLQTKKDSLLRSTESLIAHPETEKAFKTHLLRFRRDLENCKY